MANEPLVSVIIPFYSGKNWLLEAIESVENQIYSNYEIIIINDGSKENISDIKNGYNQINIINKSNGGPASARNLGIQKSMGKYIAFLDSDDIWMPHKLSFQIKEMEENNYYWSHHSYEMFWENRTKSKIIDTSKHSGKVYKDCFISFKVQTSSVVVLKSILENKNILFDVNKRYGQDTDFYKQISLLYPIGYVEGIHSKFRIRGYNAGFRARVQLIDKANTWSEIKQDEFIKKLLPKSVLIAYGLSYISDKFVCFLNDKIIKNEIMIELVSKILYLFPYCIFKINSSKIKTVS